MGYTPPFLVKKIFRGREGAEGERKRVSVLFADVAGFTKISERLDPEDVHDMLEGCFEILGNAIHGAGGTINQYTGDGVMALFGAPVASGDHCRRACHAALRIQRLLEKYRRELKDRFDIDFRMRIGIHSGPVVVAAIGDNLRLDYTAMGDTTNLAARLQSLAPPGGILVSERVRESVTHHFHFRDMGNLAVKGKTESVHAFLLLEEREETHQEGTGGQEWTPFLDRGEEMAVLQEAWSKARTRGPRLVVVSGEAGIGKTRFLEAFCLCGEVRGALVLKGVCRPYGEADAFHPFLSVFRSYMGLSGRETADELSAALNGRVMDEEVRNRLQQVVELFRRIRTQEEGSETALEGRKRVLFREVQGLFEAVASRAPLILIIDNMQWADATTREFLHFLTQTRSRASVLLICAGRPEATPWIPGLTGTSIHLGPISAEDSRRLLESVLGTELLERALTDALVSKAGGNPLFLTEMGRTMLRRDLMVCGPDRCVLKVAPEEIDIPDTVHGVLASRLDSLPAGQKRLAQRASIIGHEFSYDLLAAMEKKATGGGKLDVELKALEAEGIVEKIGQAGKLGHPKYRFTHPMMWEVAYTTLLRRERIQLHRVAGESLEGSATGKPVGRAGKLAYHFYQAQEWEKALVYSFDAAKQARLSHACREALTFFDKALEILGRATSKDPPLHAVEVYHWKGRMHYCIGEMEDALGAFQKMRTESRQSGDEFMEGTALFRLGWISFYLHHPRAAEKFLLQAVAVGMNGGWEALHLKARSFLGFVYAVMGRLQDARPLLLEALEQSAAQNDLEARAWAMAHLLQYYNWTGEFKKALGLEEMFREINDEIKSPYFETLSLFREGLVKTALGRLEEAGAALSAGLRKLETGDSRFWRPRFLNTLGWVYAERGEVEEALRLNMEAWKEALGTGDPETIYNARINMGENFLQIGDLSGARGIFEESWEELKRPGVAYTRWRYKTRLMIDLAELYRRLGQMEEAMGFVTQALRNARKTGARRHQARALLIRGRLLGDSRPAEARKSLHEALELANEMGTVLLEDRIRSTLSGLSRKK